MHDSLRSAADSGNDPALSHALRDLTNTAGSNLKASLAVTARHKFLVFMTRRDVEPTNTVSEQPLWSRGSSLPSLSVIFRRVTNGFRSVRGAEGYADIRSRGRVSHYACQGIATLEHFCQREIAYSKTVSIA